MLKSKQLLAGAVTAIACMTLFLNNDQSVKAGGAATFPTKSLEYTDLIVTATAELTVSYPNSSSVRYESMYSNASFVSYLVEDGSYVTEGDPIVEITSDIDEIALLQVKMDLERTQDGYDAYVKEAANAKAAAQKAVTKASGKTEKRLAELALEKLQMQQNASLDSYREQLEALQEKVATYEKESETIYITAPSSGLIYLPTHTNWRLHAGDTLNNGAYIGYLQSTDYCFFTLEGAGQLLRYGMEVTLTDKQGNTYPAHVANCTSSSLTNTLISTYAVVVPDAEVPVTSYEGLTATYETIHMEHVLMVPTIACHNDSNGDYVYELTEGGAMMKHYFIKGRTVKDSCVSYEGLSEGTVIVTN